MTEYLKKYLYNGCRPLILGECDSADTGEYGNREEAVADFVENLRKINREQQKLYAERKEGIVFIFQAMDAAGKDGTIRTVFSTLSPHGVKEYCFKVPSAAEASHDFLWRFWSALPEKGNISIFNRSYYEDVLIGKVHKLYLSGRLPDRIDRNSIIENRYAQINAFEKYLYDTGTRVVKIYLHVSKEEQARRFISRIDVPEKNWKISVNDIRERAYWDDYMEAFETMINRTACRESPWYVVPSDHKWYTRLIVSRIVLSTLEEIAPRYPEIEASVSPDILRRELADSLSGGGDVPGDSIPGLFSHTDAISAEMIAEEEIQKAEEKKKRIKAAGFREVRDMLASGYILSSRKEIADAVSQAVRRSEELPENGRKEPENGKT